jgi:GSCFA family
MDTFRTNLKPQRAPFSIDYQCSILGIGSCFIENMGAMLNARQLPFHQNPFGIVYNPLSMAGQLAAISGIDGDENIVVFTENDLIQHDNLWHSLQHHGKFSGENRDAVLENMNSSLNTGRNFFQKSNRLILTFGTANVFEWLETGAIVSNCHKIPPQYFSTQRLTVDEIVMAFRPIFEQIFSQKIDYQIILTVSPIRHVRDGFVENNRSKAVLLLACEALCTLFERVSYFPAYEIVMDDLRDYRFYERDMIHPNPVAIEYIWQYFAETFFDEKTKNIIREVEKINAMMLHRPLHGADTEGYQKFRANLDEKILGLQKRYPFLR